ncbi:hypothetical protein HYY74_04535 [Candidatus Woesearchaeota archaeon]|nr:hypothetical protein [Candidatus Woesearchaeota archaeon]
MKKIDLLLEPLLDKWKARFFKKFENKYMNNVAVPAADVYQFFSLSCSLTKAQTKNLGEIFQFKKYIKIQRNGWKILPSLAMKVETQKIKPSKKVESKYAFDKELTSLQREIFDLLTKDNLTVTQIACRRKTSSQAVYKVITILKKKGKLVGLFNEWIKKPEPLINHTEKKLILPYFRLHNQQWTARMLEKSEFYEKLLLKCNKINIEGNTVMLHANSVGIFSAKDLSFDAQDAQKATEDSFNYWNRIFTIVENDLKIVLVKNRYQNVKLVNQHYAEVYNEFAKDCIEKKIKVRVYATEDKKLWFLIDNSKGNPEAEFIHPKTAKQDSERLAPVFNDYRNNSETMLPSEMQTRLNKLESDMQSILARLDRKDGCNG